MMDIQTPVGRFVVAALIAVVTLGIIASLGPVPEWAYAAVAGVAVLGAYAVANFVAPTLAEN